MRERIDVSEIEATTKIRAKYLRALENEEWDLLPGPTFVKSFLRTYAQALGLDGKALVEEYRLEHERPSDAMSEPIVASPRRVRVPHGPGGRGGRGPSRGYMALVGIVVVVIVLLIVGLLSGGGNGGSPGSTSARTDTTAKHRTAHPNTSKHEGNARNGTTTNATTTISLSLRATGRVYVCLIGEGGRRLVPGQTLEAGTRTSTFHSRHFVLTLGNNAVTLLIDGTPRTVPPSSSAIGYSITKAGRVTLAPGHLPTCT